MTTTISRDQLLTSLITGDVVLVDALPESYFAKQHLPGAVNLVVEDVPGRAARLVPDKDAPIVTYCANAACPNSSQVAAALESLGYTNVRTYADGIEDWVDAGLPTEAGQPAVPAQR